MRQLINFFVRFALGAVFVYAGATKIFDPAGFADNVLNFRLFPEAWVNLVAITMPWVEVVAGICIVMAVWMRPAALVTAVLSVGFIVAVGQALARGLNIECGCFGTMSGTRIGMQHLLLDVLLLVASVWLVWKADDKRRQPVTEEMVSK